MASPPTTAGAASRLMLALRLAGRDLRGGFSGFRIFLACIALGVAAIVGVGSTARGLGDSVSREGRRILGGDVAFGLIHREANDAERAWMQARGEVSGVAAMRAMARKESGASALVELKAVEQNYPPLGELVTQPAGSLEALTGEKDGAFGFIAEDALVARLDLKVGDRILIGNGAFQLRAVLVSEPDKLAAGLGFGPRVLVSQAALRQTGLLQPGSMVRWIYRVALRDPTAAADDAVVENTIETANAAFPDAGWQVRSRTNVSPQFTRNVERFSQFLTLVGLTALIVGGVGVGNAVRAFVDRKRADLATLKSLGATGGYVFIASLLQVLLVAVIGVAIGLVVGATLPFAVGAVAGAALPVPFQPTVYPTELAAGALYGLLTALAFSLAPLGRAHDVPVASLYRLDMDAASTLRTRYRVMTLAATAALFAAVYFLSYDRRLTAIYVAATFGGFLLLRLVGRLVIWAASRAPRMRGTELRLAIANIHRPGSITQAVVLSLGLGLALLVALTLIDVNLRTQIQQGLPGKTPSFFFIDIPNREADSFEKFVTDRAPTANVQRVPMMRGRLVQVNETPADQVQAKEQASWVLEGDRGLTYATEPPEGSEVVAGEWWPKDYSGEPLVSVEREIADGLGVKIGDTLTINVLGRNITARISNLRQVNWRSLGINFVFVYSPNTFAGAPHMHLATAAFPDGGDTQKELALLKDVANAYPTITSVRVKDTFDAIARIADQLAFAVRAATGIALAASLLVLGGALSASQRGRIYDAVILKTLGATRAQLLKAYLIEYTALGLATAVFAVFAGALAAWAVVVKVMRLETFIWAWQAAGLAIAIALIVTIALGLAGTWRVLGQKPARHLRSQ